MEWVGPGMLLDTPTVPQETIQPQMSSLTYRGEKIILIMIVIVIKYYLHVMDEEAEVREGCILDSWPPRGTRSPFKLCGVGN